MSEFDLVCEEDGVSKMEPDLAKNCMVQAIAWLSEEMPEETVAFLDEYHGDRGWQLDDGVRSDAVGLALIDARKWRWWNPEFCKHLAIPPRALVLVPGHAFAIAGGRIFDTAGGRPRDGEVLQILYPRS